MEKNKLKKNTEQHYIHKSLKYKKIFFITLFFR